nr:hypothetical protein [uncultured Rhodoferax sp.]
MISAPENLHYPDVFKQFVIELGGHKRVAKKLNVTERTIWRWIAENSVPKMAVMALFWETQYGQSMIETDQRNEIVLLRTRIRILEDQFIRAKDVITGMRLLNYGTANEPYFDEHGEFTRSNEANVQSEQVMHKVTG